MSKNASDNKMLLFIEIIAVPLMVITLRNQLKFRRQSPDSPLP